MKGVWIMDAIIWRESIYKNHFKCNKCGTKLFNARMGKPTDYLCVDAEASETGTVFAFCGKCLNVVAQIQQDVNEDVFTDEEKENVLNGSYSEWLEKKERDLKTELTNQIEAQVAKRYERQIESIMRQVETAERSMKHIKADCENKIKAKDKQIQDLTKELTVMEARLKEMEKANCAGKDE